VSTQQLWDSEKLSCLKKKNRKRIPLRFALRNKNMLHVLSNYSAVQKCIYTIEQKSKASDRKGLLGGKGVSNKMQIGETVGETSGGKKRNKMTDQTSREC
jgi:hypothetical protein